MRDAASEYERCGRAVPFGIGCGKMDSEKQEKEGVTIEHVARHKTGTSKIMRKGVKSTPGLLPTGRLSCGPTQNMDPQTANPPPKGRHAVRRVEAVAL